MPHKADFVQGVQILEKTHNSHSEALTFSKNSCLAAKKRKKIESSKIYPNTWNYIRSSRNLYRDG